jgi:hypothetical protein
VQHQENVVTAAEGAVDATDFIRRWNALDRRDRLRIRRLVRLGRPLADRQEAELAVAYARLQRSRLWARTFWIWFVPGLLLTLAAAARIHPIVVGMVLALGTQAILTTRNLRRVEFVNASLLGSPPVRRRPGSR